MTASARLRPLVLALAFALPLAGCGDKSPEERVEVARQAIQKSDYKAAVIELKTALQKAPNNPEARLLLGQALHEVGQWEGSEKELRKAMELGGAAEKVLPLLANTLIKLGKYQEVVDMAVPTAGTASAALVAIYAEKGNALIALSKPAQAANMISEGEKIIATVGNTYSGDILLAKARLAYVNNQPAQAMSLLDETLQKDATFIEALNLKAQLLQADGKKPEAMKVYEQIIAAKPDQISAILAMANIKMRDKDMAAAEKQLRAAEGIDSGAFSVIFTRAEFAMLNKDMKRANEAVQKLLRMAPDHLPSVMLDAAVSYELGNYEQSLKSANKVLARSQGNLYAAKLIAANEMRQGNYKAALDVLKPLTQANPDDFDLLSMMGEISLQSKQYDKAMDYLDRASAIQPKSSLVKQSQARGYFAQGRVDLAIRELEQAASFSETAGQADTALIMIHINRKEFEKAQQAIAALEKKLPRNPVTSNLRGIALISMNDPAGARKAFDQAVSVKPDFFPAIVNLARLDVAEKKPEAARQRFETLLKADAKNTRAMMALADLALSNKQEKDAFNWMEKAAKSDPGALAPRTYLVRHYLSKNAPQQALAIAKEAFSANPNSPEALSLLGSAQMAIGDKTGSLTSFLKVSEMAANSAEAFYQLGVAQITASRTSEGRASFEKALSLQSDHAGALDGLLLLEVADRKFDRALRLTQDFQAKNPQSPIGFIREGDMRFGQKQYAQAAKAYEQGLSKADDLKVFAKMFRALVSAGNEKLADQKLSAVLTRFPKDVGLRSIAAEHYQTVGRYADSLRLYEELLQTQPNNPAYLNNMAVLYQRTKDARALQVAEQAYKLAPDNVGIMDTLGWILVDHGQVARAIKLLKQAATQEPRALSTRYHLAVALSKAGNKAEAKRELESLLKMKEGFPEEQEARKLAAIL